MDSQLLLPPVRQNILSFHHTGRVDAARPGPITQPERVRAAEPAVPQRCRHKVGGINEQEVIRAFQHSRENPQSKPESSDSNNPDGPHIRRRLHSHSREDKLQALSYLGNTNIVEVEEQVSHVMRIM
jgi:hypothetical protein